MMGRGKLALRIVAILMAVAAFAVTAEIVHQALQMDDGGPPLGTICVAMPAFLLVIGAGAVWSSTNRRDVQNDFDVVQKNGLLGLPNSGTNMNGAISHWKSPSFYRAFFFGTGVVFILLVTGVGILTSDNPLSTAVVCAEYIALAALSLVAGYEYAIAQFKRQTVVQRASPVVPKKPSDPDAE